MATLNKTTFNGGELSPWLAPRIDLEKYHTGVEIMENMNVVRYGGARARGGFLFIEEVKDSTKATRIKGFNFSKIDSVVLEFGDLYLRFYKNGVRLGAPYEIVTPFLAAEVNGLQFAQRNDLIIITHPNHHPQLLSHLGDTSWTIEDVPWKNRAWQDINDTTTTLSVDALTGSGVTMTASAAEFAADHVGSRYRLIHSRDELTQDFTLDWATNPAAHIEGANSNDTPLTFNPNNLYFTSNASGRTHTKFLVTGPDFIYRCILDYDATTAWLTATAYVVDDLVVESGLEYICLIAHTSGTFATDLAALNWKLIDNPDDAPAYFELGLIATEEIEVAGPWEFETKGTWQGEWRIQRSYDLGVTWTTIKSMLSISDANFVVNEEEDEETPALFRVLATRSRFTDTDAVVLRVLSRKITGEVLVTAFTSSAIVTVTVEKDVESLASTRDWSEDAFNDRRGFPAACTFHEERLYFGGVTSDPQTLWASVTNDYYNFNTGTEDDDGLKFTIAANGYDGIEWLQSHKTMIIGTSGNIWSLGSTDDAPITPGNRRARLQSALGCEPIPPVNLNDATVYVQLKGRRLNELVGDAYVGYAVVDLTELAEHISQSGFIQIEKVNQPDTMLLCVRADGELAIMTYDKANRVSGWCRWVTKGVIESVATVFGQGEDDEIYIVVKRTIDGNDVRYVERLKPDLIRSEEENVNLDFVYQDSAFIYDSIATVTITGLSHLEGEKVQILADGAYVGDKVVTGGVVTLDKEASKVVIGLAYTPRLRTMGIELGQSLGERKRINAMYVRLKNSQGAEAGQGDGGNWTTIPARTGEEDMDTPVPAVTKDYKVTLSNQSKRKASIEVRQVKPASLNIIAIMPKIDAGTK